ncbi:MAG: peptidylprolyl isomerase [Syntrophales bacterium]|nr:peptidylprolyl isomerase [Syntrophales bacterium]
MKSILKGLVIAAVGFGFAVSSRAEIIDRIVAVVNDEVITLSELNTAFEPYAGRIEEAYKNRDKTKIIAEGRVTVLKRLVDNKLIEQQSKKSGLTVRDDEVMGAIKNIISRQKLQMADLLKTLDKEGTTFAAYKDDIKEQLLRQRLVRREIQSKIVVSNEEIGEYYKNHREDYEGKEAVRIKQILLLFPRKSDEQIRDNIRKDAQALRKRLLAGESFDVIAGQYSQGPASQTGGDIGFIERGQTLPEVEAVAFRLKSDEISDVIESPLGFHIISVADVKGAGLKPITAVRQEILLKLEEQKVAERFDQWIVDLRSRSLIQIKL